ncbi:hypothetical protein [Streptomyces sp. WAC05950]|uniref:hypothetical protein n=1 Tax=Streptomyces sp. WAC05950 TaxID=2487419 RepID=UPI000F742A36|nr:hypothetical protein [Streptomyces sp. WAC05950]RST03751.1 hypothetical protein EF904_20740 [Streptomyces sp. WAC05950]
MSMDDRTTPRSRGQAQIILAVSPADGLVAVPVGEQYPWANTALQLTPGFERCPDGTYALRDVDTAAPILRALADTARRHRVHLFGGSRTYLGDYAAALANCLPGQWTVKVEVYSHPVWQEDLVPLLWDAGELIDCVEHIRIPYAAQLANGAGIELLLAERPGSTDEYLLGSFASATFDDNYADPHAPASIVLPSDTAHAAGLVTGTFLPAYEQAVHERLLAAVEAAHGRLEELHATWTAIQHSGRYGDGTHLDPATLGHTRQQYLEESSVEWRRLRPHAAALLSRVRPVAGAEDSASLDRLHQLLHPDVAEPPWPAAPSSPPALQPCSPAALQPSTAQPRSSAGGGPTPRPYCARHTPLAPSALLPRSGPRFPLPAQPRPPSPVIGSGERPAADDLP